jgi:P-type conjugative transfer protein TrbJ
MIKYKKTFCMLVTIISLLSTPTMVIAGGGGTFRGATEFTQILNNSELVTQVGQLSKQINNQISQITNQIAQITNQITMIQDMIHNTMGLPNQLFGNVTQIYSRIKGVMNRTQGVAYTMMNFDEEMKRRFKSYSNMSGLKTTKDFQEEYRQIINTQMETTRTTLEAINVAWDQLEKDDTKTLEQLQNIAKSADGRNQIMQSTNQLLGFLSEESLKLRQLIMIQAQMTGVALEAERAEKELGQKRHEASLTGIKDPYEGLDQYDTSSHWDSVR